MFDIWYGNFGVNCTMVSGPVYLAYSAWLLAYDIADQHRWRRMYRLSRAEGIHLQHSLFLIPGDRLPQGFVQAVEEIVHPQEDDVRAYHLPAGTRVWYRLHEVEGLLMVGLPW
jgi:Uncharacterized protein predicted to be involved in DNA repair